jgi:beta-1,4-glucosyltransferase
VLVALGNPRQEAWILENSPELTPSTYIGVGALFDFMSGAMPRAPQWMRSVRMEWLFRLYKEPRRLVRRYTIDFLKFLYLCLSLKS